MLHKTRGIVFKVTDYSESSVVVQVFTEKFGLQSYLVNGVKKPKAKIRLNMLQPLHLLDMVVYHKPSGNIQRISELRPALIFQTIPYDVIKSSLILFLNEVVYKSVKQHYNDQPLFDFLFNTIEILDRTEDGLANFHLVFLLQLSRYLGFYPDRSGELGASYFDLYNGTFSNTLPAHALIIHDEQVKHFTCLLKAKFDRINEVKIPANERKQLLESIIKYYELHIEGFSNIKSHLILEEVLS